MYTLGLILVTCLIPCMGVGLGVFFWRKGARMGDEEPARGAASGEILARIGRLAVAAGAVAAAVTAAVLLLTMHMERPWRVGVAVAVVTLQYVAAMAVVIAAARMLRKK